MLLGSLLDSRELAKAIAFKLVENGLLLELADDEITLGGDVANLILTN
jgi:hypothetical protein